MKKTLLTILILATCSIAKSQSITDNYASKLSTEQEKEISVINQYDTVVFDMSNAVIVGGTHIEIPVSIISDDVVNALDFQLTYNHANFTYETIINNTAYISMTEYYNQADETIRFTSNSFTTYENNPVELVSIRFLLISQQIGTSDINPVLALLNGDPCSIKVIGANITVGVNTIETNNFANVYPNPATESVTIEVPEDATVEFFDATGRTLLLQSAVYANQKHVLPAHNFPNGVYLMKIYNDKTTSTKKIIINK